MAVALFAFGAGKTWIILRSAGGPLGNCSCELERVQRRESVVPQSVKGGLQMVFLGCVAAVAAIGLVKAFDTAGAG